MAADSQDKIEPVRGRAAWVVVWRIVGIGATLAGNILAARLLGPADFGLFLLVTTIIALGSVLAMGGLNEAGLRFVSESLGLGRVSLASAYLRRILRWSIGTSAAAAVVVTLSLAAFQHFKNELHQPLLIVGLATIGVIVLAWQQIAAEALRGYGDLRLASLFSGGQAGGPLSNLLFLAALGTAALLLGHVSTSPAIGLLARVLVSNISMCLAIGLLVGSILLTLPLAILGLWFVSGGRRAHFKNADRQENVAVQDNAGPQDTGDRRELSTEQRRELLSAAGSLFVIQLLTFATYQLDVWVGGALLEPDDLGLFGVAKRCQLLAQLPVQMAMMAVISTIPRLRVQNRIAELEAVIRRAATLAAIPSLAALVLLAIFPQWILNVLFGGSYVAAAPVILPLIVGQLAHVIFGNPAYVLNMTGHHPLVLRINVVATLILIVGGVIGALLAGPVGLAIGSGCSLAVQNGLLWWFARQRLGIWTHVMPFGWKTRVAAIDAKSDRAAASPQFEDGLHAPSDPPAPLMPPVATVPAVTTVPATAAGGALPLDRLWWLYPAWPFAGVVGTTIVAAWIQDERAYRLYGTAKWIQFEHMLMGFAAIAAFTLGCGLSKTLGADPEATPRKAIDAVRFWFYATTGLTILGYCTWFAVGFKNGFTIRMFMDLLTGQGEGLYNSIRLDFFPTIPGVTTCTQFGVASVLLGAWLFVTGERKVVWPIAAVFVVAIIRCVLFSERTAVIELLLPLMIVGLRTHVMGRPLTAPVRGLLHAAPLLGCVGLVLFFGFFEYYRSWQFYRSQFDSYPEFTLWRLSGYFTTAHNNGAMALVTDQPRPLPYFTLRPLWEFPGINATPFGYQKLTGIDIPTAHQTMLQRYGTIELNNEGGLFQPALDFGWAGYLVYWFVYGYLSTKVYRAFQAGNLAGLTLYPLIYMSILEVPLILFLFYTRTFPPLMALLFVAWLVSRVSAHGPSSAPAFADRPFARQIPI